MNVLKNEQFPKGICQPDGVEELKVDSSFVKFLLSFCPSYSVTDLINSKDLAQNLRIKSLYIKDERERFNLGSFKATGATFAIAKMAYNLLDNKNGYNNSII